jgi:F-type H+-transporting ATPase subunit alpha
VSAQITILLALTGGLFDQVPLSQMSAVQSALIKASGAFPLSLKDKLQAANALNDDDKREVVKRVQQVLQSFATNKTSPISAENLPNDLISISKSI